MKKNIIALVCLCILCVCGCAYADNYSDAEAYFEQANTKYFNKDYKGAIKDYTKVIKLLPNCAEAYYNRGNLKVALGDPKGAIEDYTKAIEINISYMGAYYNRGIINNEFGYYKEAIEDYDKTIKLNPDYAEAYVNRGYSKNKLGYYNEAIKDFNIALNLKPTHDNEAHANALYNRAISYYKLKKFKEAEQDIEKAREMFLKNYNYANAEKCRKISKSINYEDNSKILGKNFDQYMEEVEKAIKTNWNPPKNNESKSVVVHFTIYKDGHIGEKIEIVKSSGNKEVDNAAIEAIKKTSPFDPLPEKFNDEEVDIKFSFDYYAIGK